MVDKVFQKERSPRVDYNFYYENPHKNQRRLSVGQRKVFSEGNLKSNIQLSHRELTEKQLTKTTIKP